MSVMAGSCVPEPDADYAKDQIRKARKTDLAEIDRAAAGWRAAAQRMRDVADRLYGPNGTQWSASWTGRASEEASAGFRVVAERMTQQAEVMEAVAGELDQARSVLGAAVHEAKRMDDDGIGEKVKHFFGGGEDDSKIAKQAYVAMVGGLEGPSANLDSTCGAGDGDIDTGLSRANDSTFEDQRLSTDDRTSSDRQAPSRDPVTGIPHTAHVDAANFEPAAYSTAGVGAGAQIGAENFGSLAPGQDGGSGSGALIGTGAAAAAGAVAVGGAAMLARSRGGGALARLSGGSVGVPGGPSSGAGSAGIFGGGSRSGVGPIGGPTMTSAGATAAVPGATTSATTTAAGGAAARAGGTNHMMGGMGGQGAGAGGPGSSGSGARYGNAPQLSDRGKRRRRGERRAVLGAGSREDGNEAAPVDDNDPFYDTE